MGTVEAARDRLYQLLPAIHRLRDAERGEPLRALLQVLNEQLAIIADDLHQLHDNWFIETCEDWVVPYLGELVGWQPVSGSARADSATARSPVSRREVAHTIKNRRRKGTLASLELLSLDIAGWPARAVEMGRQLVISPGLNHIHARRGLALDVRSADTLERLGTPFDPNAHLLDVRRIGSPRSVGRFGVSNVTLFVWRLRAYSVTHAPAYCLEAVGPEWYTFSILGNDCSLYTRPLPERDESSIAGERQIPGPIARRALLAQDDTRSRGEASRARVSHAYYGLVPGSKLGQSFAIWAPGWIKGAPDGAPIAPERIVVADLSDFRYTPARGQVAVDPVLGRIAFPSKQLPKQGVWVSYHYGFSADVGGGEYQRPLFSEPEAELVRVHGQEQLRHVLEEWRAQPSGAAKQRPHVVIELANSLSYTLPVQVVLGTGHTLQIRAAQGARPVLRLLDWQTDRPDSFVVCGGPGSRFVLDGLLVVGRGLRIEGELSSVTLRHSTLVPGWTLDPDCEPRRPAEPSIEVLSSSVCLVIEHSIVGSIQVPGDEVGADPIRILARDSVIDATGSDCERPECEALTGGASDRAYCVLSCVCCTVIGRVNVHAMELAENSIFTGRVSVARRQHGCVRFCAVPHGSRTPRRFHCQPDEAEAVASTELRLEERLRLRPRFVSLRYGTPGYCQLAVDCAPEISAGADDESEMGVFHQLFQPQKLRDLQGRLEEYIPAALDAGVVLVT